MNKDDFFEIVTYAQDPEIRVANYLEARGFLLDHSSSGLKMSDNSHQDDFEAANQILQKYDIGFVNDHDFIIIEHSDNADELKDLFAENQRISVPVCTVADHWGNFRIWDHGRKVQTMELEPYVARYIKAISACGMDTEYSCDGNHDGKKEITIKCRGRYYSTFHKYIQEDFMPDKFHLPWDESYSHIRFSPHTQFDYYIKLNLAADYLYKNRFFFQSLKYTLAKSINHKKAKRASDDELIQLFRESFAKNGKNI